MHYTLLTANHGLDSRLQTFYVLSSDPYGGGVSKFFTTTDSYWSDLKGNVFIKILSVFNILSLGNYFINVIFYSFFTMFGPIAIYRVMTDVFPGKKLAVLFATFLVPSFFPLSHLDFALQGPCLISSARNMDGYPFPVKKQATF